MEHKQANQRSRGEPSDQKRHPKVPPAKDGKTSNKSPSAGSRPTVDKVEVASMDSFPASDPPGYGTGHA